MKHKVSLVLVSLAMVFSCGLIGGVHSNKDKVEETHASKSSYWDSWISSNSSALNTGGTTLVSALKSKITQVADGSSNTISYNGLWDAYKTSDAVPGSNGSKIWDMYGGFQFSYQSGGSSYSKEGDCYNREHSVPKSWFSEKTPAYSDLIHLVPTDGKVNGMRSNYAFGEVSSASYTHSFQAKSYNNVQYQNAGSSKLGTPKTILGVSSGRSTVFEPDDQYKGDFARIYMYFAVRYGGGTCSATSGDGGAIFSSSLTKANPYMTNYGLALMQKWHVQDPVSTKETNRNDAVETLQGNRNPFVDYPEWADKIFGTNYSSLLGPGVTISDSTKSVAQGSTFTLTATASDNSSITWTTSDSSIASVSNSGLVTGVQMGSATITATATISGQSYSATCAVTVTQPKSLSSIAVSNQKTSYVLDEAFVKPTVTATYSDSTTDNVTASATFSGFDNETEGEQTITVSYTEGNTTKTTTYTITVSASGSGGGGSEPISSTMSAGSNSVVINVSYNSGSFTNGVRIGTSNNNGSASFSVPVNTISVSFYAVGWNGKDTTISVSISSGTIAPSSIDLSSNSAASGTISSNANVNITDTDANCLKTCTTANVNSAATVTISSSGSNRRSIVWGATYVIEGSSSPEITSIEVSQEPDKTIYTAGECFDPSELLITVNYSNSSSVNVYYDTNTDKFSFNPSLVTPLTTSDVSVTITYGGKTCTQSITVNSAAVTYIIASVSKTYYVGETISSSDISVEDNNGSAVNTFTFANDGYQFTYDDAASGGALTNKTFTNAISGSNLTCSLTVQVQRKARTNTLTENKSVTYTDLPTSYQTSTTERTAASGVKFIAYNLANYSSKMQFKASGGYFRTTESMSLKTLTINNRETNALTVYGSTNGTSFSQTITGSNDVYDLTGYSYVKVMKNASGAAYCASITLTIGSSDSAINLANYVMYEDTDGQCTSKFDIAKGYFEGLSTSERSTFMTNNDYVISTARERLQAWAAHEGKTITQANGDYVVSAPVNIVLENISQNSAGIAIIVTVSLITAASIGGYFFVKKRKEI